MRARTNTSHLSLPHFARKGKRNDQPECLISAGSLRHRQNHHHQTSLPSRQRRTWVRRSPACGGHARLRTLYSQPSSRLFLSRFSFLSFLPLSFLGIALKSQQHLLPRSWRVAPLTQAFATPSQHHLYTQLSKQPKYNHPPCCI